MISMGFVCLLIRSKFKYYFPQNYVHHTYSQLLHPTKTNWSWSEDYQPSLREPFWITVSSWHVIIFILLNDNIIFINETPFKQLNLQWMVIVKPLSMINTNTIEHCQEIQSFAKVNVLILWCNVCVLCLKDGCEFVWKTEHRLFRFLCL